MRAHSCMRAHQHSSREALPPRICASSAAPTPNLPLAAAIDRAYHYRTQVLTVRRTALRSTHSVPRRNQSATHCFHRHEWPGVNGLGFSPIRPIAALAHRCSRGSRSVWMCASPQPPNLRSCILQYSQYAEASVRLPACFGSGPKRPVQSLRGQTFARRPSRAPDTEPSHTQTRPSVPHMQALAYAHTHARNQRSQCASRMLHVARAGGGRA
jgi:hypothetical protein